MTAPVETERLGKMMRSARQRTLELIDGLTQDQLIGPRLPTVNPMLWEIGHVAWFYEQFILRREHGHAPLLERGDLLYDSIAIAHETRWDLAIYPLDEMLAYMDRVLETLTARLGGGLADGRESFLYQFTTLHEDMHDEAFIWARQTHGYPTPRFAPDGERAAVTPGTGGLAGDVDIPGGRFAMGAAADAGFLFDNEKWAHDVTVAPFRLGLAPTTNREFADFVGAGGYGRRDLWCDDGWAWRGKENAAHPVYWKSDGTGHWRVRRFDQWRPIAPDEPVIHVNWYEASAWCRWAGRRLPREAEWEFAATLRPGPRGALVKSRYPWGDSPPEPRHANLDGFALGCVDVAAHADGDNAWGCRQMIGNIWEWTDDVFRPFPGFAPDDYKEYSQPLFGITRVLRGGAWTTRGRLASATYRNYFGPDRRDVFAGFRSCALESL